MPAILKVLNILQSDWCHQHSGDVHENLSTDTKGYFSLQTSGPQDYMLHSDTEQMRNVKVLLKKILV